VLDLELPAISGLELQRELAAKEVPPIVFITAHGDNAPVSDGIGSERASRLN
jgi:FixJ family two-component response regulator